MKAYYLNLEMFEKRSVFFCFAATTCVLIKVSAKSFIGTSNKKQREEQSSTSWIFHHKASRKNRAKTSERIFPLQC